MTEFLKSVMIIPTDFLRKYSEKIKDISLTELFM